VQVNHSTVVTTCWEAAPEELLGCEPVLMDAAEKTHRCGRNALQRQQGSGFSSECIFDDGKLTYL
jgi:hypothetical protein